MLIHSMVFSAVASRPTACILYMTGGGFRGAGAWAYLASGIREASRRQQPAQQIIAPAARIDNMRPSSISQNNIAVVYPTRSGWPRVLALSFPSVFTQGGSVPARRGLTFVSGCWLSRLSSLSYKATALVSMSVNNGMTRQTAERGSKESKVELEESRMK